MRVSMEKNRAGCVLIISEDRTKFLSVSDKSGKDFNLPGGCINKYETYIDGSIRELKEETGLVAIRKDLRLLHEDYDIGYDKEWYVKTYIALDWCGEIYTEETGIVKWLPLEELKKSEKWARYNTEVYNKYIRIYNHVRKLYIPPQKRNLSKWKK